MMAPTIRFSGLEGSNPLAFLATLGVFRVLNEEAEKSMRRLPRLAWEDSSFRPVFHAESDLSSVARHIFDDSEAWKNSPFFRFAYPKSEVGGVKMFHGLTAPIAAWRGLLLALLVLGNRNDLAFAAALTSETASDLIKDSKQLPLEAFHSTAYAVDADGSLDRTTMPTSFDFTSRNAQFLDQARVIGEGVTEAMITAALSGESGGECSGRTLGWDPGADRPAALYSYWRQPNPALEWLAFRGLGFYPSFGSGTRLRTASCTGRRKDGFFFWPIWKSPLSLRSVNALLTSKWITRSDQSQRSALGLVQMFRARLTKTADGYGGKFSPAEVADDQVGFASSGSRRDRG